jgi:molybdopterin-biosynthesis enzyme MoeA-like protein
MDQFVASILIQLPLVALFIWYNERCQNRAQNERLKRDEEWRAWMRKQEEHRMRSMDAMNKQMADEMSRLSSVIERMDGTLRELPIRGRDER